MSQHYMTVCNEHSLVVAQCRCPSKDKVVKFIPCPMVNLHEEQIKHEHKTEPT